MAALGGATRACHLMASLLDRVLHEGDEAGLGVDVPLAELAVRALSQAALGEGRQAVLDAKGVRVLLEVLRIDSNALEAIQHSRWEQAEGCTLSLDQTCAMLCIMPKGSPGFSRILFVLIGWGTLRGTLKERIFLF